LLLETRYVALDFCSRIRIILVGRQFEKLAGIRQAGFERIQRDDDLLESRALLAQRLRAIRFVPDVRLLQFALNLGQALRLGIVVKDTPSTLQCVRQAPRWSV